jgi:hypothetical protein
MKQITWKKVFAAEKQSLPIWKVWEEVGPFFLCVGSYNSYWDATGKCNELKKKYPSKNFSYNPVY